MARIIFMGTPDFAVPCLQKLIATQTVVGVVTQPDRPAGRGRETRPPPVKVAAQAAGIPVYQPASLRSEEAASPLLAWEPDLIVVAAFGDKEASPSERNFALGVITDSVYGKHRGVEPTEKTNQNIDITINGKPFDPVSMQYSSLTDEAKAEREATIARLRGEVVATQESGDGS